jgi:hypothetical protein
MLPGSRAAYDRVTQNFDVYGVGPHGRVEQDSFTNSAGQLTWTGWTAIGG